MEWVKCAVKSKTIQRQQTKVSNNSFPQLVRSSRALQLLEPASSYGRPILPWPLDQSEASFPAFRPIRGQHSVRWSRADGGQTTECTQRRAESCREKIVSCTVGCIEIVEIALSCTVGTHRDSLAQCLLSSLQLMVYIKI